MNQPKGSSTSSSQLPTPTPKRAYRSPQLREYGSVPILTQSVSNNKNKDGGPNNIKT